MNEWRENVCKKIKKRKIEQKIRELLYIEKRDLDRETKKNLNIEYLSLR